MASSLGSMLFSALQSYLSIGVKAQSRGRARPALQTLDPLGNKVPKSQVVGARTPSARDWGRDAAPRSGIFALGNRAVK